MSTDAAIPKAVTVIKVFQERLFFIARLSEKLNIFYKCGLILSPHSRSIIAKRICGFVLNITLRILNTRTYFKVEMISR